jgi:hypothetical protein
MFLNSLGLAYAMINDYKMAYVHVKQALQILLTSLGANHIEVCDVYSKLEEAKKNYLEAQRIVQSTFGNEHTKAIQLVSLLFIIENYNSLSKRY